MADIKQSSTPTWAEEHKLGAGSYKYDDVDKRWMYVKPDGKTFILDKETSKPIEGMPYIPSIYERLGEAPVPVGQVASPRQDIAAQPDMTIGAAPPPPSPTTRLGQTPPPPPATEITPARKIKKKGPGAGAKKASGQVFNAEEEVIYGTRPQ